MLDSVLSEDALVLPCKAILKTCALSIPVSFILTHPLTPFPIEKAYILFVLTMYVAVHYDYKLWYATFWTGSLE